MIIDPYIVMFPRSGYTEILVMKESDDLRKKRKGKSIKSQLPGGNRREGKSHSGSKLFFRSVFENTNDATFLMEGETFIDCNRKTGDMFGCRSEDILQQKPCEFSPPLQPDGIDSREKAQKYILYALLNDVPYCRQLRQMNFLRAGRSPATSFRRPPELLNKEKTFKRRKNEVLL